MTEWDELDIKLLKDMKKRRDMLNRAIADLKYRISHPLPPLEIDFEEIKLMAEHDIVWFDLVEQERDKREVDIK